MTLSRETWYPAKLVEKDESLLGLHQVIARAGIPACLRRRMSSTTYRNALVCAMLQQSVRSMHSLVICLACSASSGASHWLRLSMSGHALALALKVFLWRYMDSDSMRSWRLVCVKPGLMLMIDTGRVSTMANS